MCLILFICVLTDHYEKELPRVDRAQDPVEDQKSQLLCYSESLLDYSVFLLNFIKTYILLNFIHYYKTILRRNRMF